MALSKLSCVAEFRPCCSADNIKYAFVDAEMTLDHDGKKEYLYMSVAVAGLCRQSMLLGSKSIMNILKTKDTDLMNADDKTAEKINSVSLDLDLAMYGDFIQELIRIIIAKANENGVNF